MKILIIARRPTHPANAGSRRFILNQAELFKTMGHNVHFLFIYERSLRNRKTANVGDIEQMKNYWGDCFHIYKVSYVTIIWYKLLLHIFRVIFRKGCQKADDTYPWRLSAMVRGLHKKNHFDCCIINYYELSRLFNKINIPLLGITTHDYYSYKNILVGKRYVMLCTDAHQEAMALQRCPHIFALNTEEAIFFKKLSPKSEIYNVFSVYKYKPNMIVGNKVLLFLSGSNPFNISGLYWFVNSIFPIIVTHHPNVLLRIGGAICQKVPELKSNKNIELVGYVNDMTSFYESADVFINPTFEGTGLKIKTFESIAYDKVTMTHPHSRVGIFDPEKAPIFSSEEAGDWASFLSNLWSDKDNIKRVKQRNKEYLFSMQDFVVSEYQRFFNHLR